MSEIRTKPASKKYRDNYDIVFRNRKELNNTPNASGRAYLDTSAPLWVTYREDENVDCGEFNTHICCADDPNFGG